MTRSAGKEFATLKNHTVFLHFAHGSYKYLLFLAFMAIAGKNLYAAKYYRYWSKIRHAVSFAAREKNGIPLSYTYTNRYHLSDPYARETWRSNGAVSFSRQGAVARAKGVPECIRGDDRNCFLSAGQGPQYGTIPSDPFWIFPRLPGEPVAAKAGKANQ